MSNDVDIPFGPPQLKYPPSLDTKMEEAAEGLASIMKDLAGIRDTVDKQVEVRGKGGTEQGMSACRLFTLRMLELDAWALALKRQQHGGVGVRADVRLYGREQRRS
jgi:hypothetical protein